MPNLRVAFVEYNTTERGTSIALYDYAHYNEYLLGNTSIIFTPNIALKEAGDRFARRFKLVRTTGTTEDLEAQFEREAIDRAFIIKWGIIDAHISHRVPTCVQCIFDPIQPHGTTYCSIFPHRDTSYLPHIAPLLPRCSYQERQEYRRQLGIPADARVIGRHGGYDSFNLPWVKAAIPGWLEQYPQLYLVFLNTEPFYTHPRLIHLERTTDLKAKALFIAICDVMLHARDRGETFGLSCAEFDLAEKPILTYSAAPEREALRILGDRAWHYTNATELSQHIKTLMTEGLSNVGTSSPGYRQFTPERVMARFQQLVIDCNAAGADRAI